VVESKLNFKVTQPGILEGLMIHIQIDLDHENVLSSRCSPETQGAGAEQAVKSHWANIFVMLSEELEVSIGDSISVQSTSDLDRPTPEYTFELCHTDSSGMRGDTHRVTTH